MKKYAVIGNPVSHSLSPLIHREFASQFNINLIYTKIRADSADFSQKITDFRADGGSGLNVTLPHKKAAFIVSDQLSEPAMLAEAVNTLSFREGLIVGDNTDGTGLVNDLQANKKIDLKDKRILILGAGGAVSGVIGPLLSQQPDLLVIANRTAQKAFDLQAKFSKFGQIIGCGLNQIERNKFDLVINATSASLAGEVPQISANALGSTVFAYDMMYAKQPTAFINWARRNGVTNTADGLGMLVEQAAAAFHIWHDKRPVTATVLEHLRRNIKR